ncbi:cell division protein ZapA [Coralloluteibacterium stylophorae]|uniref:Cell division protein ZapA n=1 Tax=Coralloluteibacterium stylophorae TaxID=1776034 RepID=A0A8J7VX70_9GAMM|nr:cell division protein ZapA [Coralloluteibacterium stylophorae]MBS7458432.1 cell division protein ZapA [Coralloluteibacterium stylophorae]
MSEPVKIRILDREFLIGCAEDEREGLLAAARMLDGRMREIRSGNRMATVDRIAVIAALNLAHELVQLQDADRARGQQIQRLVDDVDAALQRVLPTP